MLIGKIVSDILKGKAFPEGHITTYKDGTKKQKTNGKWVLVTDGKSKKVTAKDTKKVVKEKEVKKKLHLIGSHGTRDGIINMLSSFWYCESPKEITLIPNGKNNWKIQKIKSDGRKYIVDKVRVEYKKNRYRFGYDE